MKHLIKAFLLCTLMCSLVGCKSNEQRANELIKDYMFKHLHDFSSYEPVETQVDTAYNIPINNAQVFQLAKDAVEHKEKADEYQGEAEYANRKKNIWSDSYSSYGRQQYKEAFEEQKEQTKNYTAEMLAVANDLTEMYQIISGLNQDEVLGWSVVHSFRCKNRGGNTSLSEYLFIVDKKFETILSVITDDDDLTECGKMIEMALLPDQVQKLKETATGVLEKLQGL